MTLNDFSKKIAQHYTGESIIPCFDAGIIDHPLQIEAVHSISADTRILICLRSPVDRALSEWKMRVRRSFRVSPNLFENRDFFGAIEPDARDERSTIDRFDYLKRSLYAERLRHCYQTFGRERVKVLIMEEDLAANRHSNTYRSLFEFIGIADAAAERLATEPPDKGIASSRAPSTVDIVMHLKDGTVLTNPTSLPECDVDRLEIRSDVRTQLNEDLLQPSQQMLEVALLLRDSQSFKIATDKEKPLFETHFSDDVKLLEDLIDRDLSCWYARYG